MAYKMKCTPFQSWKMYMAIREHFKQGSYDIFVMNGRFRGSQKDFDKRPDKSFFVRYANEYLKGDLANFYMANIMDGKTHISDFEDRVFREWKGKMHQLEYKFESDLKNLMTLVDKHQIVFYDLFRTINGQLPMIIQLLKGGHINIETLCIIDIVMDGEIMLRLEEQITDKFIWPELNNRIIKYMPWIKIQNDVYKNILISVIKR